MPTAPQTILGSDVGVDLVAKLNANFAGLYGNHGTGTIDFGAFPGSSDASLVITGQTGIVAGSVIIARLQIAATADHTADEHRVETIRVDAGSIVAGVGFTIYASNTSQLNEPSGKGTRITGMWAVQWEWM